VLVAILLVVIGILFLYKTNRLKGSYSLHLPSVSFRDFFKSATSGARQFSNAAGTDDTKGLVSSSNEYDDLN